MEKKHFLYIWRNDWESLDMNDLQRIHVGRLHSILTWSSWVSESIRSLSWSPTYSVQISPGDTNWMSYYSVTLSPEWIECIELDLLYTPK